MEFIPKVKRDKGVAHLFKVSKIYYAIKSGAAAMFAGQLINAVNSLPQMKCKPQLKSGCLCGLCPCCHSPGHDNCPAHNDSYKLTMSKFLPRTLTVFYVKKSFSMPLIIAVTLALKVPLSKLIM